MAVKNIFKAWKLETFQELLKYDKIKAYEYRKRILGTPIPEKYLKGTEVGIIDEASEIVEEKEVKKEVKEVKEEEKEVKEEEKEVKKVDNPEEIMSAVEDDAFEDELEDEFEVDKEIEQGGDLEKELSRKEMMDILTEKEIDFKGNASNKDLLELYKGII